MWTLNVTLMLLCVATISLCADSDGSKYVGCRLEMWTLNVTLMLLCVATMSLCADTDGSKYVGCKSSSDCGSGRCCVFLNGRYPTTACDSHRRLGESCRPRGQPFSQALNYPGGATVQVTAVYQGLCPCDLGLSCHKAQCVKA